jgi:hypothetical protein
MSTALTQRCSSCAYFDNAPETLERLIPGLRMLSSGYAAARNQDGICSLHDRYLPAGAQCSDFTPAHVKPASVRTKPS